MMNEVVSAAKTAFEELLNNANWNDFSALSEVERQHCHRLGIAMESSGYGWRTHLDAQYDKQKSPRNRRWFRVDFYASKNEPNSQISLECKRCSLSRNGIEAGDARYSKFELVKDWATDLRRLRDYVTAHKGWETWRVFYLVLSSDDRSGLLQSIQALCAQAQNSQCNSADLDGFIAEVEKLWTQATMIDAVRQLIVLAQSSGLHVYPILPKPYKEARTVTWYPVMICWK